MVLTNKQKLEYYRRKELVKQIVLDRLKKTGNIMTGSKAVNRYLPPELRRLTQDYDILIKNGKMTTKQAAYLLEKKLDKGFGGNYFEVKKGIYPGVNKVVSRVTKGEVADYVRPDKTPKFKKDIDGVNVAVLAYLKKKFRESLKDPKSAWRHNKDKEALQRIALSERDVKPISKFKWKVLPKSKTKITRRKGGKLKW